eukprot:GHVL01040523.1.p1 GENE.GHVL01040523.1~~GHVL01040523.1.p1  ORF type:complete len:189 (-),score=81.35 GHVL01040523.1:92-658(-)
MKLLQDDMKPLQDNIKPLEDDMKLLQDNMKPLKDNIKPLQDDMKLLQDDVKPLQDDMKPSQDDIKPLQDDMKLLQDFQLSMSDFEYIGEIAPHSIWKLKNKNILKKIKKIMFLKPSRNESNEYPWVSKPINLKSKKMMSFICAVKSGDIETVSSMLNETARLSIEAKDIHIVLIICIYSMQEILIIQI